MDVHAIRTDLAAVGVPLGYTARGFVPEDVAKLPALIANPPREVAYGDKSLGLAHLTIPLTVAFSGASLEDAQARMDAAISSGGITGSVVDAVNAATSDHWRKVRVASAEPARLVSIGQSKALAVDLLVDVWASRREQ